MYTPQHESIVCCVKFSHDGRYLTTGCSRPVQIYDVGTGVTVCILQDERMGADDYNYMRSACFSPDGKYPATAAEDRLIRVSFVFSVWP